MSNSYDNIYKLIKFTNSKVDYFEGTKKYISTGDSDDIENGQEVTFDNKPSRANVMGSAGDILIAKMANTNKVILLDNYTQNNIYSTGFYCLNSTKLFNKYLFYLLSNDEFNKEKDSWSFGTTQVSLNENGFKRIKINFVSDIIKQMKISKFLDKKVLLLDKILENQQQQIEKLKEYKQSLISEVVTKGLDQNVDLKDSGIQWVGMIPRKWSIDRLKYVASSNDESLSNTFNSESLIEYVDIGSVSQEKGIEKTKYFTFNEAPSRARRMTKINDILVSTVRTYLKAIAVVDRDNLIASTGFSVIRPNNKVNNAYLSYYIKSDYFTELVSAYSNGISYPAINDSVLMSFYVIKPPLNEQEKISLFLKKKVTEIDKMVSIKEEKIEKLNEYKKSLIYEYVTGKKEVS